MTPHRQSIASFPVASPLRIAIALGVCAGLLVAEAGRTAELGSIKSLTVEEARKLAQDRSGRVLLDDLPTLTADSALDELVTRVEKQGGGIRTLIHELVQSPLFQTR